MSYYRFTRTDELKHSDDELYHYGRSKKDGAPGVGTGNWRRSGGPLFSDLNGLGKRKLKSEIEEFKAAIQDRNHPSKQYYKVGERDKRVSKAYQKLLKNDSFVNAIKSIKKEYANENIALYKWYEFSNKMDRDFSTQDGSVGTEYEKSTG